jgi:hypothetical protein
MPIAAFKPARHIASARFTGLNHNNSLFKYEVEQLEWASTTYNIT